MLSTIEVRIRIVAPRSLVVSYDVIECGSLKVRFPPSGHSEPGERDRVRITLRSRTYPNKHHRPMNKLAWGYVFVVIAVLLWTGNAVIGRIAPDVNVPPLALNFWRWMIALLVLAPFAFLKLCAQRDLFKAHWRLWTVFGIVTVASFNSAYYVGLQYTTVVQGTLISAALPIFVLVAARVFLAQPITHRQLAGVVISIIGVAIIVVRGDFRVLGKLVLNIGDVWILVAVCMWAAQTILIRFVPERMDLIAFQVMAVIAGLTALAPFYIYETVGGRPMPLSWSAALLVGYAGLAASVVGFTCWNLGVMQIGPKSAGYFGNLFPVFGAALGILLLGEPFRWFHAVGGIVTLSGIYLATITSATPRTAAYTG
jgi:drug/metabolite transporter (DMT)-like permease